ncbi:MAG: bifunctional biotin--[acetyl-CoA-carboxylase] ligase/biotin operon repressor BirA [Sedimenticola sp.]|nr:bifunctional biotin--[acetyl-CoA-carboxylase] ligase/biotin operon repressor BirA [Sedimenticola sp.]
MAKKPQLLHLLADGQWHSGQEMAGHLGISRAAVWKQLELLKEQLGLEIHAVRGRGYRLARPLELLDEAAIRSSMTERGRQLVPAMEIHDTIASTSSHLMSRPVDTLSCGHACLAERQTAGRGRRGRHWVSPFAGSVYLSLYWRYSLSPAELSGVSLAAGLAVVRALEQLGIPGVGLKWPNDVLHEQRKLAGLLLEVSGEQSGPSRVVLGLGLNVSLPASEAHSIDQPWVDLDSLPGGRDVSRNHLVAVLLDNLVAILSDFESGGLVHLVDEWRRHDLYDGQRIRLQMGERKVEGIHRGIDPSGALLLETADGIHAHHGGEVSLRPVERSD